MRKMKRIALAGVVVMMCACSGCGKKDIKNDYIELESYNEVDIKKEKKHRITEEDIMSYIEDIQQRNAIQREITDQPVEMGDTVSIDFSGKVDGKEIDGSVEKDYTVTVGTGEIVEGFDDNIIGRHIGEKYDFTGQLPKDYYDVGFAGKRVEFEIKVNTISRPELLPLNDEFVGMVSDKSKNVEEYKKEVKEILEKNEEEKIDKENQLWEALLEKTKVENYPKNRVEEYSKELIENCKESAQTFGMEYERFVNSEMGMTVDKYEQEVKKAAQNIVKEELVIEAISEKEKLIPNEKEYEEEYKKLAQEYGYESVDSLKKDISEKDLEYTILKRKVREWLLNNCKVQKSKS